MSFSLSVVYVGKPAAIFSDAVGHYCRLIKPFAAISLDPIKPLSAQIADAHQVVELESEGLLKKWPARAHAVALTPEGKTYDTFAFSKWMQRRREESLPVVFTIGGAFGLSERIKAKSRENMSLSALTFCHGLCLVVLLEQIYRAGTILNGHPYHK